MHDGSRRPDLSPSSLLAAYCMGFFPMADDEGEIHWLAPNPRAVIELGTFSVSRSLRTLVQRGFFEATINRSFDCVIESCADRSEGTWISDDIRRAYGALHRLGYAHSVETWREGKLAGGLYGVAIGGAFFGESMFHRIRDASKVALVHLVQRLKDRGFLLLDVQFQTEHLRRFGAVEIRRAEYQRRLAWALKAACTFGDKPPVRIADILNAEGSDD